MRLRYIDVVAVSDLHGILPSIPTAHLLIIAGDIFPAKDQRTFCTEQLVPWLLHQPVAEIVAVAGRNDRLAASGEAFLRRLPWRYLCNRETLIQSNFKVWGSPYSLSYSPFGPFTAPEKELKRIWREIPADTNLIVCHGGAYGLGDKLAEPDQGQDPHAGSKSLRWRMAELPTLRAIVSGHVHEGYGTGVQSGLRWVNASHMDESWRPFNPPIAFRIDLEKLHDPDLADHRKEEE